MSEHAFAVLRQLSDIPFLFATSTTQTINKIRAAEDQA